MMKKLHLLLLAISLAITFPAHQSFAQICSGDSPLSYSVIQGPNMECFLQINWDGAMPEIGCGSPGTPAAGSNVPNNRILIDLQITVNNTTYILYSRGNGNSCNNAVLGLQYGGEPNSYITNYTTADFCEGDNVSTIQVIGNQTGASSFNCDLANANIPQPVELSSFQGYAMEKSNELTWETASEENAMVFVLERSKTGKAPFEEIGSVPAAGFSSSLQAYQYTDEQPLPISYYRLRNIDFDGTTAYSNLIVIERAIKNIFKVIAFPVPFQNDQPIQIYFEALRAEKARITLSDPLGRLLFVENLLTKEGVNRIEIDVDPQFSSELYILSIDNGAEVIVKKLLGGAKD